MSISTWVTALSITAALGMGPSLLAQQASEPGGNAQGAKGDQKSKAGDGALVTVTGCLTAAEKNGFILTADPGDLDSAMSTRMKGAVTSATYQLVGGDHQQLSSLIGRSVEVKGKADKAPRTAAKHETERESHPKAEGTSGGKPKVETTEKVKVEVRKLTVASIRQTGGTCAAR